MGSVFGRWAEIVGPDLAAHTRPDSFADGELAVTADSTAWATQVRLLASMLVRRLNDELGDGSVRRVKVVARPRRGSAAAGGSPAAKDLAIPTARPPRGDPKGVWGDGPPGAGGSWGVVPPASRATRGATRPWQ